MWKGYNEILKFLLGVSENWLDEKKLLWIIECSS